MADAIVLGIKLTFDGKAVEGGVSISRDQFRQLAVEAKKSGEAISGGFTGAAKGVRSISEMLEQARNATAGFWSIRELAQASDAWTNLRSRIDLVSPTAQATAQAMVAVFDISQKSGQSLSSIGDVYQKIARNAVQYNLTAKDTATITQAVANAVRISGGTAESSAAALVQFGQALASNRLGGDELRSVLEQTPALAEAIARGMGKTIGELRLLGEAGQLTGKVVLDAITKEAGRLNSEVDRLAPTIGQAVTRLNNAFQQWTGSGGNGGAAAGVANSINGLAANFNGIADAALIAGSALASVKLSEWAIKGAAAFSQFSPHIRLLTLAMTGATAAWVLWNRVKGEGTPLDGVAETAQRAAAELAKTTTEIKALTAASYQSQIARAEGEKGAIKARLAVLNSGIEKFDGNRSTDPAFKAMVKEAESLDAAWLAVNDQLATLKSNVGDVGLKSFETFTKADEFMTKQQKQTAALEKAGLAYSKAWIDAGRDSLTPKIAEERRGELLKQYLGHISETLDYKGISEALSDALVNAAKNSARRSGEQFKQELEQYRMSSAEFIRSMRELELGTLSTERKAVSRSQVTDPKDRIAKDSRLKEIDAEIADVGRKYGRMAEDFAAKREATQIKMDAELGKLSSPNERAYASLLKDYGEELKRAIADGDWITVDKWKKMLGMREATEAFGDLSKSFEAEIKRMEASLTGNQIGVALGSLTQESADFAERGIRSSAVAALRQLRDQMVTTAGDSKVLKDALADIEAKLQGAAKGMAEAPPTTFWEAANAGAKDYLQSIGTVAKQQEQMFTKAFQGMEDALVSFVKTGKLDFKSLADSIITDLIRMQVRAAMEPVTQGLTGWLQGLWSSHPADIGADAYSGDAGLAAAASIGGAHEGAIAGMEATFSRSVPLSLFSGASRYHTGGILPGEVPIIARRGEGIFTPEQMRALAPVGQAQSVQGGNVTVNVVNNAAGTQATAKERTDGGGNRFVDVFIEQIKGAIASDITRGSGAVPSAIQGTYGLNRTAGAY